MGWASSYSSARATTTKSTGLILPTLDSIGRSISGDPHRTGVAKVDAALNTMAAMRRAEEV